MDKMDKATLAQNNGQDGKKALVAYQGKVYDVTESKRWKGGKHMNRHLSGTDLTADMTAAPHGADVLERFQAVAEFFAAPEPEVDEVAEKLFWPLTWLYAKFPILRRHLHPVAVHFPIGSFAAGTVFALLALVLGNESMATTSWHVVLFATILAPAAYISGLQTWWLYYDFAVNPKIAIKLVGGIVLFVLGIAAAAVFDAGAVTAGSGAGLAYVGLSLFATLLAFFLGYIGGGWVFPD
jgi:predicted heme/steroid binding protein/uncharacterized membrane protein